MNTTITAEEAKKGANMRILAKNKSALSMVEEAISMIGTGAYAKDGNTLYLNVNPAHGFVLKEALLGTLEQHGIDSSRVKIQRIHTNESASTRYKLKEEVYNAMTDSREFIDWALNNSGSYNAVQDMYEYYTTQGGESEEALDNLISAFAEYKHISPEEVNRDLIVKAINEWGYYNCNEDSENEMKVGHKLRLNLTREGFSRMVTKSIHEAFSRRTESIKSLPFDKQVAILTNEARKIMIKEGTGNFFLVNSDTYHVLSTPHDEDGNETEWNDDEYDIAISDVIDTFLHNGWDKCDANKRFKYDSYSIGVDMGCTPENFSYTVYAVVLVCPGYYESATIDYEIVCGDEKLSEFNSVEDFAEECVEWYGDFDTDEEKSALTSSVVSCVENLVNNFEETVDKCTEPYGIYARFNNGETMYSKIRKEDFEHGTDTNPEDEAQEDIYDYSYFSDLLDKFGWAFHDSYVDESDGSIIFAIDKYGQNAVELDELKTKLREVYGDNIKFGTRTETQAPEIKHVVVKLIHEN